MQNQLNFSINTGSLEKEMEPDIMISFTVERYNYFMALSVLLRLLVWEQRVFALFNRLR